MSKIIISYRRADSAAIAGRIRDRLVGRYGDGSIFMDVENIPLGSDFRTHIREVLLQSDALIAIIGPDWLGAAAAGGSRVQNETDPVRIEIETALKGGIPLIPVLVSNAHMPDAADLPESLRNFAFLNAAEVDSGRDFHQHMDRLVQGLDSLIEKRSGQAAAAAAPSVAPAAPSGASGAPSQNRVLIAIAAAAAVVLLAGGVGAFWFLRAAPTANAKATVPPTDLARVDECIRDNKDEPGGTPPIVRAYCVCMSEKMDRNEKQTVSQWESSHSGARKTCEKLAGWD